jgi:hypothetical protein
LFRNLADTIKRSHGQWSQKSHAFLIRDNRQAVGLFVIAGDFGQQFVGGDANRGR